MKRNLFKSRRCAAGISLLEVLLSLSIIAIILVMATRYFFVANDNDKVNMARQEIGSLIAGINAWKNQNPQYTGLTIKQLSDDGFLAHSNSLSPDQSTLYGPWGTAIQMNPSDTSVQISLTLPKASECKSLMNSYPDATCDNQTFTLTVQ